MQKGLKIWMIIGLVVVGLGVAYYVSSLKPSHEPDTKEVAEVSNNSSTNKDMQKNREAKVENKKETQKLENNKNNEKDVHEVSDIDSSMMSKTITVRCKTSNVKTPKDTTFFKINDVSKNKSLNGVMFNKTNQDNAGRRELLEQSASSGSIIYIDGEVSEYKGALQIKAWRVYTK